MQDAFQKLFALLAPFAGTDIGDIVIQQCNEMLDDFDRSMQIKEVTKGGIEGARDLMKKAQISKATERQ